MIPDTYVGEVCEPLKEFLKKHGFSLYKENGYFGTAMNIARGVKIEWYAPIGGSTNYTTRKFVWAKIYLRVLKSDKFSYRGKTEVVQVSEYESYIPGDRLFHLKEPSGGLFDVKDGVLPSNAFSSAQEMFEAVVDRARGLQGSESISKAKLALTFMQNLILLKIKDRLDEKFGKKGRKLFSFKVIKAMTSLHPAVLTVSYTIGSKSVYRPVDLFFHLHDGVLTFNRSSYRYADYNSMGQSFKIQIPSYSDPSFDPDVLYGVICDCLEPVLKNVVDVDKLRREITELEGRALLHQKELDASCIDVVKSAKWR